MAGTARRRDRHAGRGRAVLSAVQADDGVEVHEAAPLELGDLREGDADALTPGTFADAGAAGEDADQFDHEAVPQRGGVPVPQHRALVVIRRRTDRPAELRVIGVVALAAPAPPAVVGSAVDRSERRRRQAREDLRVLGDLLRHALAPARQAGVDELPHVAAVLMRTRGTARLTPVAAAHHEHAVRLVGGRVHRLVAVEHDPTQPRGMPARPGAADLLQPALALGITRPRDQPADGRRVQLVEAHGVHRQALSRGHKTDTSAREHANIRDSGQSSRNPRAHDPSPSGVSCP
jgi:hypothetical protein